MYISFITGRHTGLPSVVLLLLCCQVDVGRNEDLHKEKECEDIILQGV